MPSPREQPNPPVKNRRRPDVMPGGWLWLVLLILLVLVLLITVGFPNPSNLDYSNFEELARQGWNREKDVPNTIIKKVVLIGSDRLEGELQESHVIDPNTPAGKQLRGRKFTTGIPPSEVQSGNVTKLLKETHIHFSKGDDTGAWFSQL